MQLFILLFLVGFLTITAIGKTFSIFEKIFLSLPVGFAINSFAMFVMTFIIDKISLGNIYAVNLLIAALLGSYIVFLLVKKQRSVSLKEILPNDFSGVNLVVLVFAGVIIYLVKGITMKCLYWPPAEFDTILGYDLLAKAIANEGKLANSILTNAELVNGCGPRLLYPPLLSFSNSLCYYLGMQEPKIINAIFYVSWVGAFYTLLRKLVNSTNAIFFTFFTVIIPEMFAHGSFSLTNLPTAYFGVTAVLCFLIWYYKNEESYFYLSMLLLAAMLWTRADSIFILFGIGAVLLILFIKQRNFKHLLLLATSGIPFLIWNFYSKAVIPRAQTSFFVDHLFFDFEKLGKVISKAWEIANNSNLYGITVSLFLLILIANVIYMIIKKSDDNWALLTIIFVSLGTYTLVYYQIDDKDGLLFAAGGGWLESGYKRGLFLYLPLLMVYGANSFLSKYIFDEIGNALAIFKKPSN